MENFGKLMFKFIDNLRYPLMAIIAIMFVIIYFVSESVGKIIEKLGV